MDRKIKIADARMIGGSDRRDGDIFLVEVILVFCFD